MKTKPASKPPKPPILTCTLNWSGDVPKAIRKKWKAITTPHTVTFAMPTTAQAEAALESVRLTVKSWVRKARNM